MTQRPDRRYVKLRHYRHYRHTLYGINRENDTALSVERITDLSMQICDEHGTYQMAPKLKCISNS